MSQTPPAASKRAVPPLRLSHIVVQDLVPNLLGSGAHMGPHLEWGVDGVGQSSPAVFHEPDRK